MELANDTKICTDAVEHREGQRSFYSAYNFAISQYSSFMVNVSTVGFCIQESI